MNHFIQSFKDFQDQIDLNTLNEFLQGILLQIGLNHKPQTDNGADEKYRSEVLNYMKDQDISLEVVFRQIDFSDNGSASLKEFIQFNNNRMRINQSESEA